MLNPLLNGVLSPSCSLSTCDGLTGSLMANWVLGAARGEIAEVVQAMGWVEAEVAIMGLVQATVDERV